MTRPLFITTVLLVSNLWGAYQASQVLVENEKTQILKADLICAVTVQSTAFEERIPMVATIHTVQVEDCAKGPKKKFIKLVLPGGKSKDRQHIVPGTPQLKTGESYLLYLEKSDLDQEFTIRGLTQGVRPIVKQGKRLVVQKKPDDKQSEAFADFKKRVQRTLKELKK